MVFRCGNDASREGSSGKLAYILFLPPSFFFSPPEALIRECWAAVEQVRGHFAREMAPFSAAMFAWRPGACLAC
jgi:hypothetical protein